jgi:hypothetical protein
MRYVYLETPHQLKTEIKASKIHVFWAITLRRTLKANRPFREIYRHHLHCRRIIREGYSFQLFLLTHSSETSVDFQRTTQSYVPENITRDSTMILGSLEIKIYKTLALPERECFLGGGTRQEIPVSCAEPRSVAWYSVGIGSYFPRLKAREMWNWQLHLNLISMT